MSEENNEILTTEEKPTAAEIEKQLLEQQTKISDDPSELAAMLFTMYLPKFHLAVNKLSSNALRRVLKALIEVPICDVVYNHQTQDEKDAWAIGDRLIQAKFMLIQESFMKHQDELQKATDATVVENPDAELPASDNKGENDV